MTNTHTINTDTTASKDKDAGFSLVELAIYVVLLGIISSIVASTVVVSFRSEQTVSDTTNVASSSQNFITAFSRDMRNARSAEVSSDGSTITAEVASTSGDICWNTVTWTFAGDRVERNGGALIDAGVTSGSFGADNSDGVLSVTDTERTVTYNFKLGAQSTVTHPITGSLEIGPPHQTEGESC